MGNEDTEMGPTRNLTYDEIISDLSSIPLNQHDVLFDKLKQSNESDEWEGDDQDDNDEDVESKKLYDQLEKLVLLNAVNEGDPAQKHVETNQINKDLESLEKRVESLQHFINLSKKFLSVKEGN